MTDNAKWHLGDDGELSVSPQVEFKVKRGSTSSFLADQYLDQVEAIIVSYRKLQSSSHYDDLSDISTLEIHALLTRARAAIERISSSKSIYSHHAKSVLNRGEWDGQKLKAVIGILESLRSDLEAGFLKTFEESIRSDMYADLLQTASAVKEAGNQDAATIIAGTVLLNHLWKLATKHNIVLANATSNHHSLALMTQLNDQLTKHDTYNKLDHDNIAAWLDLWDRVVSGQSGESGDGQVNLMLPGIRELLSRYPA